MSSATIITYIVLHCGDEETREAMRLRALAGDELHYAAAMMALYRLRKWAARFQPNGVVPADELMLHQIARYPDGPAQLVKLLLLSGHLEEVANGYYLAHWREEQFSAVLKSSETLAARRRAGKESGRARREKADEATAVPPNTKLTAETLPMLFAAEDTPKYGQKGADNGVPLGALGVDNSNTCSNRREETRPEKTREEKTTSNGVVSIDTALKSVVSSMEQKTEWRRVERCARTILGTSVDTDGMVAAWRRKKRFPCFPAEADVLEFLGKCVESLSKSTTTPEQFVVGAKYAAATGAVERAAKVWREA